MNELGTGPKSFRKCMNKVGTGSEFETHLVRFGTILDRISVPVPILFTPYSGNFESWRLWNHPSRDLRSRCPPNLGGHLPIPLSRQLSTWHRKQPIADCNQPGAKRFAVLPAGELPQYLAVTSPDYDDRPLMEPNLARYERIAE